MGDDQINEILVRNHDMRISALEAQMSDVRITLAKVEKDMTFNNKMTEEIRNTLQQMQTNTSDLVDLSKGFKLLGRIAVWGGGITSLILAAFAIQAFMKGM